MTRWRRMGAAVGRGAGVIGAAIGVREIVAVGGLGLVFHGLRMVYEPAAFITVGAALFALGIVGAWRRP